MFDIGVLKGFLQLNLLPAKDPALTITGTILHPTAASGGRRQLQDRGPNQGKSTLPPLEFGVSCPSCPCPKPLIFPPLLGKHPNLFHASFKLAREIPPSRDNQSSEQARYLLCDSANLTFKAARAGLRPAPARVPVHSFPAGPHLPAGAEL